MERFIVTGPVEMVPYTVAHELQKVSQDVYKVAKLCLYIRQNRCQ